MQLRQHVLSLVRRDNIYLGKQLLVNLAKTDIIVQAEHILPVQMCQHTIVTRVYYLAHLIKYQTAPRLHVLFLKNQTQKQSIQKMVRKHLIVLRVNIYLLKQKIANNVNRVIIVPVVIILMPILTRVPPNVLLDFIQTMLKQNVKKIYQTK